MFRNTAASQIQELWRKQQMIAEKWETRIDDTKWDVSGQDGRVGISAEIPQRGGNLISAHIVQHFSSFNMQ